MSPEKEQILYDRYPHLFSNRLLGPRQSCMSFGCEVGEGWFEILSSVCFLISRYEKNMVDRIAARNKFGTKNDQSDLDYIPVKFDQIKEKFGGLTIYYSGGDEYVRGLVAMAGEMSYKTCERCGYPGEPSKTGWIKVLCERCSNERNS